MTFDGVFITLILDVWGKGIDSIHTLFMYENHEISIFFGGKKFYLVKYSQFF